MEGSENEIIDWVRSWLQRRTKWLLLLDNADDVMSREVFQLLPRIGGDIIITTRDYIPPAKAEVIPIDKMTEEEALSLLVGPRSIDRESPLLQHAKEIIVELDYLPLAINLAHAYISNMRISLKEYLEQFKDRRSSLLSYRDKDNSEYNHSVATVWQISLERVRSLDPVAGRILEACCFLQPDAIPMGFFERQSFSLKLTSSSTSPEKRGGFRKVFRAAVAGLGKLCSKGKSGEVQDHTESGE